MATLDVDVASSRRIGQHWGRFSWQAMSEQSVQYWYEVLHGPDLKQFRVTHLISTCERGEHVVTCHGINSLHGLGGSLDKVWCCWPNWKDDPFLFRVTACDP